MATKAKTLSIFDPTLHGHRSAQVGDEPLVTLFVKL